MNATEFIKENYTLINGGEDYICNHSGQLVGAEDIAEAYHQAKLKLLGMGVVVGQSEQLCGNLDKNLECRNMCLTHCIDGNKFWK